MKVHGGHLRATDSTLHLWFVTCCAGYVHAMAHQLGGFYDLPHGVCNAVLLPVVQEFNAKVGVNLPLMSALGACPLAARGSTLFCSR